MNRFLRLFLAAALVALAASTVAVADGVRPTARATAHATVRLKRTDLGKILVSGSGATLFIFSRDGRNRDQCVTISGCTGVWPVLKGKGRLTAGPGLKRSRLSTIKLSNGARQVVYRGHPLYTYSFANGPGDTSYVGTKQFGGSWYALTGAGRTVK